MNHSVDQTLELTNGNDFIDEMNVINTSLAEDKILGRSFRPIKKGSTYFIITNIVICGFAISFFWYPVFCRVFGLYLGTFFIAISALSNFITSKYITDASEYLQINEYLNVIQNLIPNYYRLALFTFALDYFTSSLLFILLPYNILLYILYNLKLISPDTATSDGILEFHHYNTEIVWIRFIFAIITFFTLLPFYFMKNMKYLRIIFYLAITTILIITMYMLFDLNSFRNHYIENGTYTIENIKTPNVEWFKYSMIFLTCFYLQSNILTIKKDLDNVNAANMNFTLKVAFVILVIFSTLFGFYGYYCMGDKHTSDIFVLRRAFEGKSNEITYLILLGWYGILLCALSAYYNVSLKLFMKDAGYKLTNLTISVLPLFLILFLIFVYPKIVNTIGYTAIAVCATNGYIFPCLLKNKINMIQNRSFWKKMMINLQLAFYLTFSILSFLILIREDFMGISQ